MSKKLQNVKAVQQMLDGTHKFQTKKTVGFSDAESKGKQTEHREIGDVWEETDANGNTYVIEQREGFRIRKTKNSDIFQSIQKYVKLAGEEAKKPAFDKSKYEQYRSRAMESIEAGGDQLELYPEDIDKKLKLQLLTTELKKLKAIHAQSKTKGGYRSRRRTRQRRRRTAKRKTKRKTTQRTKKRCKKQRNKQSNKQRNKQRKKLSSRR